MLVPTSWIFTKKVKLVQSKLIKFVAPKHRMVAKILHNAIRSHSFFAPDTNHVADMDETQGAHVVILAHRRSATKPRGVRLRSVFSLANASAEAHESTRFDPRFLVAPLEPNLNPSRRHWPPGAPMAPLRPQGCVFSISRNLHSGSTEQIRDPKNGAEKWINFWGGRGVTDSRVTLRPPRFHDQKTAPE